MGSDLPVGARQQAYEAVIALSREGYTAKMAGSLVKYKASGSTRWEYVNPREKEAIHSLTAAVAADEQQQRPPPIHQQQQEQQQQYSQDKMKQQGRQQQSGRSRVPGLGHLGEQDNTAGVRPPKRRRKQQNHGKPAKFRNPRRVLDSSDSLGASRNQSSLSRSHNSYNSLRGYSS